MGSGAVGRVVVGALVGGAVLTGGVAAGMVHGRVRLPGSAFLILAVLYGLAVLGMILLAAAAWRHRRDHPEAFRSEGPGLHVAAGAWIGGALASPLPLLLLREKPMAMQEHLVLAPMHALTGPFGLAYLSLPLGNVLHLGGMLAGAALGWGVWRRGRGAEAPPPAPVSRAFALLTAAGVGTAVLVALGYAGVPIPLFYLGKSVLFWAFVGVFVLLAGAVAGLCGLWRMARRARARRERALAGGLFGGVLGYCVGAWLASALVSAPHPAAVAFAPLSVFLSLHPRLTAWGPLLGYACIALGSWLGTRRVARAEP